LGLRGTIRRLNRRAGEKFARTGEEVLRESGGNPVFLHLWVGVSPAHGRRQAIEMEKCMAIAAPVMTLDQEINPWEAQSARFEFAARKLNLDENLWKVLSTPSREIIVHFPVIDG
jgi:hypothetical protein